MKKKYWFVSLTFLAMVLTSCTHFHKLSWVMSSNPSPKDRISIQRGEVIYKSNCLSCHGNGANGDGPNSGELKRRPSDLVAVAGKKGDSTFAARVAYGMSSSDEMPKFILTLTEQQIWDVTNYIYSLK